MFAKIRPATWTLQVLILLLLPLTGLGALEQAYLLETRPSTRLMDEAELLSKEEARAVELELQALARDHGKDIFVVTGTNNPEPSAEQFAETFYRRPFMGDIDRTGLILVIDMGRREMYVKTFGAEIERLQAHIDPILDAMAEDLSAENPAGAIATFIKAAKPLPLDQAVLEMAMNPVPYGIALVLALLVTIILSINRRGTITVNTTTYQVPGSFRLTRDEDIFLRTDVSRTKISSSSSGSSSSGSGSSGGGGRSF